MAPQTKDMRRPDLSESSGPPMRPARAGREARGADRRRPALRAPDLRLWLPVG